LVFKEQKIIGSISLNGVEKEPVYLALGIKFDGSREILGFWLFGSEGESAKNWEEILRELSRRGVKKVQLFITDEAVKFKGVKGFNEIEMGKLPCSS